MCVLQLARVAAWVEQMASFIQFVEKGKPLISRRRLKPKETPSSQSEVFGAEHKGGTQRKNPHVEQQVVEEHKETVGERCTGSVRNACCSPPPSPFLLYHTAPQPSPSPPPNLPRDRSATGPSRPPSTIDNKQQTASRYQKQVSSPAGNTPSYYHPHHMPVHYTSFTTRPDYHGPSQIPWLYSHPESEYEKLVAESDSKDDFFQQQQER